MRRAVWERLGLLPREVIQSAFGEAFRGTDGLDAPRDCIDTLVAASLGHPCMVQLPGHYLVALLNADARAGAYAATGPDAERAVPMAISAFEDRALRPLGR
jgi:hypothetical protein